MPSTHGNSVYDKSVISNQCKHGGSLINDAGITDCLSGIFFKEPGVLIIMFTE